MRRNPLAFILVAAVAACSGSTMTGLNGGGGGGGNGGGSQSRGDARHRRGPIGQRQRKIFTATTKLSAPHSATTPTGAATPASEAPSIITPRKASFNPVSGNAFTNGCSA